MYTNFFADAARISSAIAKIHNLSWNEAESYMFKTTTLEKMEWYDCIHIGITPGHDVDGILFYGDGSIEFVISREQYSEDIDYFPKETIEYVRDQLEAMIN